MKYFLIKRKYWAKTSRDISTVGCTSRTIIVLAPEMVRDVHPTQCKALILIVYAPLLCLNFRSGF